MIYLGVFFSSIFVFSLNAFVSASDRVPAQTQSPSTSSSKASSELPPKLLPPARIHPRYPVNKEEVDLLRGSDETRLINPPIGVVSPEIRNAEKYIRTVMDRLLKDQPIGADFFLKLSFIASENISIKLSSLKYDERSWANYSKSNDRSYPMRPFLNVNNSRIPLFNLTISTALLRRIKTEDELAFFLASKLLQIKETLLNPESDDLSFQNELQTTKTALEVDAINWLERSKYSIDESLSALKILYSKESTIDKQYRVAVAAVDNVSNEGIRFSTLQAKLEQMHRRSSSMALIISRPLLVPLQFNKAEKNIIISRLNRDEFVQLNNIFSEIINDDLTVLAPSPFMLHICNSNGQPEQMTKKVVDSLRKMTALEIRELFLFTLDEIKNSNASPQGKGNAIFRVIIFFFSSVSKPELTFDDQYRITQDIARYLSGPNGWKAFPYLNLRTNEVVRESYMTAYYSQIFFYKPLSEIFKTIIKSHKEIKILFKELGIFPILVKRSSDTNFSVSMNQLRSLGYSEDKEGLRTEALNKLYDYINSLDLTKVVTEANLVSSLSDLKYTASDSTHIGAKNFANELLKKIKNKIQTVMEPDLLPILSSPISDLSLAADQVKKVAHLSTLTELSPLFKTQFLSFLTQYALQFETRSDAYPKLNQNFINPQGDGIPELFSQAIENPGVSEAEKNALIHYVLGFKDISLKESQDKPAMTALYHLIFKELRSLSVNGLLNKMKENPFIQYKSVLYPLIGELNEFPIGPTDKELESLSKALRDKKIGFKYPVGAGPAADAARMDYFSKYADKGFTYMDQVDFLINFSYRRKINIISILGARPEGLALAKKLDLNEFKDLMQRLEKDVLKIKKIKSTVDNIVATNGDTFDASIGLFLLTATENLASSLSTFEDQWLMLDRIRKLSPIGYSENWEILDRLGALFSKEISLYSNENLKKTLSKKGLISILPKNELANLLRKSMPSDLIPGVDFKRLKSEIDELNKKIELQEKFPSTYSDLRNLIVEEFKIPPNELESVFTDSKKTTGEKVSVAATETRGFSALIEKTRQQKFSEQISLIEYLMQRSELIPDFIKTFNDENSEITSPIQYIREMRARLSSASQIERTLIVNSFLAGPNGAIQNKDGLKAFMDFLLRDISPKNLKTAEEIAYAIIYAEGEKGSFALSYVLAQKGDGVELGKNISESQILKSLFEAYGVPGIKLGQYLAFSSELNGFRDVLESLQDSAMPISYFEAIKLIENRFGVNWNKDIEVTGLIGSGSVNVALGYHDRKTSLDGVISILRENIEESTKQDFQRFQRLISELTKTEAGIIKYGYLAGLSSVIEKSVELEFNKKRVMKMQNDVVPMYNEKILGWNVGTIHAYNAENGSLFMERAKGKGARKILKLYPESYRSAMLALSQVEILRLLGVGPDSNPFPIQLYANPDFHDGQVLIDLEARGVQILDFGQSVYITNEERNLGVILLRAISKKSDSPIQVVNLLNKNKILNKMGGKIKLTEIQKIYERTERMDIFIQLLSLLNRSKMEVPLSSTHWVLAVNRQIALGKKIGVNTESIFEHLVLLDKLGLPQVFYNAAHFAKTKICNYFFEKENSSTEKALSEIENQSLKKPWYYFWKN